MALVFQRDSEWSPNSSALESHEAHSPVLSKLTHVEDNLVHSSMKMTAQYGHSIWLMKASLLTTHRRTYSRAHQYATHLSIPSNIRQYFEQSTDTCSRAEEPRPYYCMHWHMTNIQQHDRILIIMMVVLMMAIQVHLI